MSNTIWGKEEESKWQEIKLDKLKEIEMYLNCFETAMDTVRQGRSKINKNEMLIILTLFTKIYVIADRNMSGQVNKLLKTNENAFTKYILNNLDKL